jgi:hypothetical protein
VGRIEARTARDGYLFHRGIRYKDTRWSFLTFAL